MSRLPASQRYRRHVDRWKRYEKPLPGHRVQIDVKFIAPLQGSRKKHYQFTAIDDCTRIRVLRIYDRLNQKTAIQFLDYVLEKLPFRVEVIQTDNGAEFRSQFHYHVLDRGIGHVYIKPATPRLNGKVERSHRIDAEEFYRMLEGVVIDDTELFNDRLQEWEDFYNFDRPHGGLGGQTPYERLRQKTRARRERPPSVAHLLSAPGANRTKGTKAADHVRTGRSDVRPRGLSTVSTRDGRRRTTENRAGCGRRVLVDARRRAASVAGAALVRQGRSPVQWRQKLRARTLAPL